MGGCPFIPGAAGNIATEDAAYFLDTLGMVTGVDGARVAECAMRLEAVLGRRLPGKMLRVIENDREHRMATDSHTRGDG
jgi:hydroxymethylglutaryl-CoA lyase